MRPAPQRGLDVARVVADGPRPSASSECRRSVRRYSARERSLVRRPPRRGSEFARVPDVEERRTAPRFAPLLRAQQGTSATGDLDHRFMALVVTRVVTMRFRDPRSRASRHAYGDDPPGALSRKTALSADRKLVLGAGEAGDRASGDGNLESYLAGDAVIGTRRLALVDFRARPESQTPRRSFSTRSTAPRRVRTRRRQ